MVYFFTFLHIISTNFYDDCSQYLNAFKKGSIAVINNNWGVFSGAVNCHGSLAILHPPLMLLLLLLRTSVGKMAIILARSIAVRGADTICCRFSLSTMSPHNPFRGRLNLHVDQVLDCPTDNCSSVLQ